MPEIAAPHHECRFVSKSMAGSWTVIGPLKERPWTVHFACAECGRERPSRRPRAPSRLEQEASPSSHPQAPEPDPKGRAIANFLLRSRSINQMAMSGRGLLGAARRMAIPATMTELWAERFLQAGWVRLTWRLSGTRRILDRIEIIDRNAQEALTEYAAPGRREEHRRALEKAKDATRNLTHPVAQEVRERLASSEAESYDPALITALAAVAVHVESGDTLAERVFAARYLGDSKALIKFRPRLERIVGPLEHLGIREGAAVTLMGGSGRLFMADTSIDLAVFHPFIGLPREMAEKIDRIELPAGGLFVVENLTVFEACCRGEVKDIQDCLILWSAGYPGRAVRAVVERSAAIGSRIRVWADLDLDGIRIVRLIASWSPKGVEPYRMSPQDVEQAVHWNPLPEKVVGAIKRDLTEHPSMLLSGTLEALLAANRWVEQEVQLGN